MNKLYDKYVISNLLHGRHGDKIATLIIKMQYAIKVTQGLSTTTKSGIHLKQMQL